MTNEYCLVMIWNFHFQRAFFNAVHDSIHYILRIMRAVFTD